MGSHAVVCAFRTCRHARSALASVIDASIIDAIAMGNSRSIRSLAYWVSSMSNSRRSSFDDVQLGTSTFPCSSCSPCAMRSSFGFSLHGSAGNSYEKAFLRNVGKWYSGSSKTPCRSHSTMSMQSSKSFPSNSAGWDVHEVITLPNSISLLRLLSGPVIAHWIIDENWNTALPALALSGLSDWFDGLLARRNKSNSVLGSYLDPLADKVLIGSVVGALGYSGALPLSLAAIIVGRDAFLILGTFVLRARSLHWRWHGMKEFFRVVSFPHDCDGKHIVDRDTQEYAPAAPVMRPLFISKANTVLQIGLVGLCMTDASLGWPGGEAIWGVGAVTSFTTIWSCVAYVRLYLQKESLFDSASLEEKNRRPKQ